MSDEAKVEKVAILGGFSTINSFLVQLISVTELGDYKSVVLMCSSPLALIITYLIYVYVKVNHFDSVAEKQFNRETNKKIKEYRKLSQSKKCTEVQKSYYLKMMNKCIKLQSEHDIEKIERFKIGSLESKTAASTDVISALTPSKPKKQ
jgi:hypothetical protein